MRASVRSAPSTTPPTTPACHVRSSARADRFPDPRARAFARRTGRFSPTAPAFRGNRPFASLHSWPSPTEAAAARRGRPIGMAVAGRSSRSRIAPPAHRAPIRDASACRRAWNGTGRPACRKPAAAIRTPMVDQLARLRRGAPYPAALARAAKPGTAALASLRRRAPSIDAGPGKPGMDRPAAVRRGRPTCRPRCCRRRTRPVCHGPTSSVCRGPTSSACHGSTTWAAGYAA
jgi:hypothetical protein